ncbi:MAG: hypothetical protein QM820_40600 [Minicystis sp.]
MHLIAPLVVTALAIVAILLATALRKRHHATRVAIAAELARRGLRHRALPSPQAPTPDAQAALDAPQRGIAIERQDGASVWLSPIATQGAATLPGFGPVHPQQTLVELDLALPDQLICSPERAVAAFGPFPPHPRRTGNPAFDQRFGVFVREEGAQGYRPAPADPTPWARSPAAAAIFADFDTLGFLALHVHEGRGRFLFAPQAVDGLVAALDTATALAHPEAPRAPARPPSRLPTNSAGLVLLFAFTAAPVAGGWPLLPLLTEEGLEIAGSSVACPRGGTFKKGYRNKADTCIQGKGTSYRAESAAYAGWQFAVWAPLWMAMLAAGVGLWFKLRGDAACEVQAGLSRR